MNTTCIVEAAYCHSPDRWREYAAYVFPSQIAAEQFIEGQQQKWHGFYLFRIKVV